MIAGRIAETGEGQRHLLRLYLRASFAGTTPIREAYCLGITPQATRPLPPPFSGLSV